MEAQDQVAFAAMCKDREDHKILADLCLLVAIEFSGLVDFGGQLTGVGSSAPGNLWAIPYETHWGGFAIINIGDVEFLRWWSTQTNFRMIK